jgi:hypothetical protein
MGELQAGASTYSSGVYLRRKNFVRDKSAIWHLKTMVLSASQTIQDISQSGKQDNKEG